MTSTVVTIRPKGRVQDDPRVKWPGRVDLDCQGVEIAIQMLDELDAPRDGSSITMREQCELENCWREGQAHRNVLLEYLTQARAAGPAVEAAFCAIVGNFVASSVDGSIPNNDYYAGLYGIE
jgi:hypothetical protein